MRVIDQNKRVIKRTSQSREFLCEKMLEGKNATLVSCTHDHITYIFDEGKFSRKEMRPESHDQPHDVIV
jgi:hypothetical protein